MKFTELNFDCLETVLEYLELIDLLNVANSTKRLNKAAELVFARKHGKKSMEIGITKISRHRSFKITDKEIFIDDLKTALQLLRCFGPVIFKIRLREIFGQNAENLHEIYQKVVTYINKFCADYLEELEIDQFGSDGSDLLNYFDTPFPKLKKFDNKDLVFTENFCLNRLFPKVRCLIICYLFKCPNSLFYKINTEHFPYLEDLSILDCARIGSYLSNEMMINLLKLNPQLRKFKVCSWNEARILNLDFIRSAVDSLQNVENLSLQLGFNPIHDDNDTIFRMKNVKSFDISFVKDDIEPIASACLPFTFENLEEFRIAQFRRVQLVNGSFIDQFFNFIDRHSSIRYLSIGDIERFGDMDWSRLAKSLPLLIEFYIFGCYISDDEAIEIIAKFKMLKKFGFRLKGDYDNFRKRLDKNWEGTYSTYEFVELKRKM